MTTIEKHILFFTVITLSCLGLWGQDCQKYDINTQNMSFKEINEAYKNHLLTGIVDTTTPLPQPLFKDLAACWLNTVSSQLNAEYTIGGVYEENNPDIIFLIINSRSIDSKEEKQSWFNLMPMMNDDQMHKLYRILERELLRINMIEVDYEKRRERIKEIYTENSPLDTLLPYLVYTLVKTDGSPQSVYRFDLLKGDQTQTENDFTIVYPGDKEKLRKKVRDRMRSTDAEKELWFMDQYDNVFERYLLNIKNGNGTFPSDWRSQNYLYEWWKALMYQYMDAGLNSKAEAIATIPMEDGLSDSDLKEYSQIRRWKYLSSIYLEQGEYSKSIEALKKTNEMTNHTNVHDFLITIYKLVVCDEDPEAKDNIETCAQSYITLYNNTPKSDFYESMKEACFGTSIMLCDYYISYGQNTELKNIVSTIRTKLYNYWNKNKDNLGATSSDDRWYVFLNRSYLDNSFAADMDYNTLKSKVERAGFLAEDTKMVEFASYYCLWQMINGHPSRESNVVIILKEVDSICMNSESDANQYIEKYIAKNLSSKMLAMDSSPSKMLTTDSSPSKMLTTDFYAPPTFMWLGDTVVDNSNYTFTIVIGVFSSEITNVEVYCDAKEKEKFEMNEFGRDGKNFKLTNASIRLEEGDNTIKISYEDGIKKYDTTITVTYNPKPYMDRHDQAIMFACNKYTLEENDFNPLEHPIKETEELAQKLYEYGFDTLIIRNPTLKQMSETLREYCTNDFDEYDQLIIYFSGHGKLDEATNLGYMVPTDGKAENPNTMYPYFVLRRLLDNSQCRHILVISDACHSGSFQLNDDGGKGEATIIPAQAEAMKKTSRYFIGSVPADKESNVVSSLISDLIKFFDEKEELLEFYGIWGKMKAIENQKNSDPDEKKVLPRQFGTWGKNEPDSDFYFNRR